MSFHPASLYTASAPQHLLTVALSRVPVGVPSSQGIGTEQNKVVASELGSLQQAKKVQ